MGISRIGPTELLLIIVLALVLFGGGKLGGLGKALGTSIREFKREINKTDEDSIGTDLEGNKNKNE